MANSDTTKESLKTLTSDRKSLLKSLSAIEKYVTTKVTPENIDFNEMQVKHERLDSIWSQLEQVQRNMENLKPNDYDEYHQENEDRYLNLKVKFKQYLNPSTIPTSVFQPDNLNNTHSSITDPIKINANLPKLRIPVFDGKYDEWRSFYDVFTALIHDNNTLSNIEKLFYLKSNVRGEALKIIEGVPSTASSYNVILELLVERYNKKQIIINTHVKALFDLPNVTKDSAASLRSLIVEAKQHLRSLVTLDTKIDDWDPLLIHMLSQKLDMQSRRALETHKSQETAMSINEFYKFIENRCVTLEALEPDKSQKFKSKVSLVVTDKQPFQHTCSLCKDKHHLYFCKVFSQMSYDEKVKATNSQRACFNCLRSGHTINKCFSRGCKKCNRKHHTLLHREYTNKEENTHPEENQLSTSLTTLLNSSKAMQVILSTVQLKIKIPHKSHFNCRALLDSASQANFITKRYFDKLNINTYEKLMPINGIQNSKTTTTSAVTLTIVSRLHNFQKTLEFLIIDNITQHLPSQHIDIELLNIPPSCTLADPAFNIPAPVDMLIGGEIFFEILEHGTLQLGDGLPSIQNSIFGWIIGGKFGKPNNKCVNTFLLTTEQLNDSLTKFWNLENCYTKSNIQSQEEKHCELIFQNTTKRTETGRYIVDLPLKEDPSVLGHSYEKANRRFSQLQKRFLRNPDLYTNYNGFMNEYINLKHMETFNIDNRLKYFIPHHAVYKKSEPTKIRVVFDASMKTTSNKSLNDILMIGPTLYQDLFSIITRFRKHRIAFSADVQKMYRQILINKDHRPLQTILWKTEEMDDVQMYSLNTVTYGTSAAPYLATKCIQQLAIDEKLKFPLAAERISRDFYVDDLLTGSENETDARILQQEIISILKAGCFDLHKWCSNSEQLLKQVTNIKGDTILFQRDNETKTLGIIWCPTDDIFKFVFTLPKFEETTKRSMLSTISSLFDPLGILGPVIVKAKLLIQELWKQTIDWDQPVPINILNKWQEWKQQLQENYECQIPRCLQGVKGTVQFEIHGFCDASQIAYGAVLYLRCENENNEISTSLICSKSRVAPIKPISLPRLELCGAVVLSRLVSQVITSLEINVTNVYLWTDSTIVLCWLNENPSKWTTFVANRVSEIQDLTKTYRWRHVPSEHNPADCLSRGANMLTLKESPLWWQGPAWLCTYKSTWPEKTITTTLKIPETKSTHSITSLVSLTNANEIFDRFSKLSRLIRSFTFVLRFINNTQKKTKLSGSLSILEIDNATRRLIKLTQEDAFQEDINCLITQKALSKSSKLNMLNPFLDESGILRVRGRIKNALVPYDQRHPIILPQRHRFTHLLIEAEHIKLLHAGAQSVLANIRRHYWPLNAKSEIRKILHKCITCFRFRAKTQTQFMADLPPERLQPSRPFLNVGLDYGGPVHVRSSQRKNAPFLKTYIALFVCLSTKAIHLELAIDLSTEAFLRVLQRFVSRRGTCKTILSDNGTNFRGATNELQELYQLFTNQLSKTKIVDCTTHMGIEWKFIPPNSPHFGGIWEAGIKAVKYHLKRTLGNAHLTYEETYTLFTQIEACLNSRPLVPISNDPNDFDILTPSHFLTGDMLTCVPFPNYDEVPINRLSRLQLIQKLQQGFWKKRSMTYLNELQQRHKWQQPNRQFRENQLVLVREDHLPPLKWITARILQLHPGSDNLPRVATIKTSSGAQFKRPIVKLCPLPISEPEDVLKATTLQGRRDVSSLLYTSEPEDASSTNSVTKQQTGCVVSV